LYTNKQNLNKSSALSLEKEPIELLNNRKKQEKIVVFLFAF